MARPDLSHVTQGLTNARTRVAAAKEKVGSEEAVAALDEVDAQLAQAQQQLEDALAQAGQEEA
jgi:hypothetical protein